MFIESPSNWRVLSDASRMRVFDYEASYRPVAALPHFVMISDTLGDNLPDVLRDLPPMPFQLKKQNPMVSAWISNCDWEPSQRLKMAQELSSHGVSVRNYGRCPIEGDSLASPEYDLNWEHLHPAWNQVRGGNYRPRGSFLCSRCHENILFGGASPFYFAAENSICEFYHTEKAYLGLLAGSVPIYLGHDSAKRGGYFPVNSVIFASDYSSPRELASYLLQLMANETAYNAYFKWRNHPLPSSLREKIDLGLKIRQLEGFCWMCDFLRREWNNHSWAFRGQDPARCRYADNAGHEVKLRQAADGSLTVLA